MSLKSKAALIILIGIACFFSLYKLTESPPLWYDEGIYDQLALNSALGHGPTIQVAPGEFVSGAFVTGGYPFIRPIAWTFQLFGIGVFQSRIVMAFFIIAALIGFFFLLRALFGTRSALISLALLGSFPMLYGNGKNVLGEIPGLFYLSLFLLAVFQIEKQKFQGILPYILAGISGGLCLSTKPIFFLLGGAVVVASILCRKHIIFNWRSLIVGFISFLIPLGIWVGLQFHATDSATTILQYYANPYGIPDLMGQIISNATKFISESSPMYFMLMGLVWVAALIIRLRLRREITLTEAIAFTFSLLVSFAYLRTAGWYRYFFVAQVVSIAFLPNALSVCIEYITERYTSLKNKRTFLFALTIGILCIIQVYQLLFTSWVAAHYASTRTHDLVDYFQGLSSSTVVFLYNAPEVALFVPGQKYYQYLAPTASLKFGEMEINKIASGTPDIIVVPGYLLNEVMKLSGAYTATSTHGGYIMATQKP